MCSIYDGLMPAFLADEDLIDFKFIIWISGSQFLVVTGAVG